MKRETHEKANELSSRIKNLKDRLKDLSPSKTEGWHVECGFRNQTVSFGYNNDRSKAFIAMAKSYIQSDLDAAIKEYEEL